MIDHVILIGGPADGEAFDTIAPEHRGFDGGVMWREHRYFPWTVTPDARYYVHESISLPIIEREQTA